MSCLPKKRVEARGKGIFSWDFATRKKKREFDGTKGPHEQKSFQPSQEDSTRIARNRSRKGVKPDTKVIGKKERGPLGRLHNTKRAGNQGIAEGGAELSPRTFQSKVTTKRRSKSKTANDHRRERTRALESHLYRKK